MDKRESRICSGCEKTSRTAKVGVKITMIKLAKRIQVWLILHLWTIIPIFTIIHTFNEDKTLWQKLMWLKSYRCKIDKENSYAYFGNQLRYTSKRFLLFRNFGLFVLPILVYSEHQAYPLR